jgi:hypothetical protein
VSRGKCKIKKVGCNHHVWDANCLEEQPANLLIWTGILISAAVRMSNLMLCSPFLVYVSVS